MKCSQWESWQFSSGMNCVWTFRKFPWAAFDSPHEYFGNLRINSPRNSPSMHEIDFTSSLFYLLFSFSGAIKNSSSSFSVLHHLNLHIQVSLNYFPNRDELFQCFFLPEIQITGALSEIFLFVSVRFSCSSLPPVHRWGNHCPVNHKSRSGEKGRTSLKREMKLGKLKSVLIERFSHIFFYIKNNGKYVDIQIALKYHNDRPLGS